MKRFLLLTSCTLALTWSVRAQSPTNSPTATPLAGTNAAPAEITIDSESLRGVLTNKMLVAVYTGNVRVNHPRWSLRAGIMTTSFPVAGKRLESLVLESNVFIVSLDERGRTNTARGDKAIYECKIAGSMTNETIVLIGQRAVVETPDAIMESDRIDGDLRNGTFDGGPKARMRIKGEALGSSTNNPIFNPLKRP